MGLTPIPLQLPHKWAFNESTWSLGKLPREYFITDPLSRTAGAEIGRGTWSSMIATGRQRIAEKPDDHFDGVSIDHKTFDNVIKRSTSDKLPLERKLEVLSAATDEL